MRRLLRIALALVCGWHAFAAPEPLEREYRGMWIATVGNIDWPSKPGLPVAQQKAELSALLERAKRLNLNAVVFQVRPAADAMYASSLEPWSEYLTGRMGVAPQPRWDPLEYACDEAHSRALELHAWINPYRARNQGAKSPVSRSHVSVTHPAWTVAHGKFLWLDPGNPEARSHTLKVVTDLVRRYDIDALHIDDYFYPYPERGAGGGTRQQFADQRSFSRYRQAGGRLALDDWRRQNVNEMVEDMGKAIHREKGWVKFGISPFGIWRPNNPPGIQGLDQYAELYADARLWVQKGWADYFAPQLYWPSNRKEQGFSALLQWWIDQNVRDRVIVPGIASASIGKDRQASDIANQVRVSRSKQAGGVFFWNAGSLRDNRGGVASGLTVELFKHPALPPSTPWLGTNAPAIPSLQARSRPESSSVSIRWKNPQRGEPCRFLVLQTRIASLWTSEVMAAADGEKVYDVRAGRAVPDEIWLYGISRTGTAGEAAVWTKAPVGAGRGAN